MSRGQNIDAKFSMGIVLLFLLCAMFAELTHAESTIIALATPPGTGALAVIRLSGADAIRLVGEQFRNRKGDGEFTPSKGYSVKLGYLCDEDEIIDEVLVTVFRAPKSFTGENVAEISCHGSVYIQQRIIELFIRKGARLAGPGEFTRRAFLNRKMDLTQAEAVADLIASDNKASHEMALQQMRGGFGKEMKDLRQQLIDFASLIELELDFSEEDVEFASRTKLNELVKSIITRLQQLTASFQQGNVLKNGIPVAIIGLPNAGKSTLLNALLNEEKAIVSEIPGTTRDFIEDKLNINGVTFRIIDTAGLRESDDVIEQQGVLRSRQKMEEASLILYIEDVRMGDSGEITLQEIASHNKPWLRVYNKTDLISYESSYNNDENSIWISAKNYTGIEELKKKMYVLAMKALGTRESEVITNARYYEALEKTIHSLKDVLSGLDRRLSGEFISLDLRKAIHELGSITGQITTDDLLGSIFSRFCIGK